MKGMKKLTRNEMLKELCCETWSELTVTFKYKKVKKKRTLLFFGKSSESLKQCSHYSKIDMVIVPEWL